MKELKETLTSLFLKGPLISEHSISKIGRSLIVAPHPDDESLACGGTIALLRNNHYPVYVIFITDGSMSHPNSKLFRSCRLKALRELEAVKALSVLDILPNSVTFLGLPDSKLNELSPESFIKASKTINEIILQFRPNTIFLPWRKDPHPDHIASWHLLKNAIEKIPVEALPRPILLEYLLWFWERTDPNEIAPFKTAKVWSVDITSTLSKKADAILEHRSQLGLVIKDDPDGFSLPPSLLKKMQANEELYIEYRDFWP